MDIFERQCNAQQYNAAGEQHYFPLSTGMVLSGKPLQVPLRGEFSRENPVGPEPPHP